jgi:VCBS repeat-containing protein
VGFLNGIVTNLLNPFLAPAPNTPEPVTPAIWAVLAWVRRNFFNEAPTIAYDPTTTVQTGQTVTGNLGATDPEGDALAYTVTQGPQHGSLAIDQATGKFTYTPDDIDYDAAQTDSFTVSVADGKFNLLSLFSPHTDQETIDLSVLSPTVERVIVNMPNGITKPVNPRYSEDGKSIYFAGTPTAGGRSEIYQINIDGTDAKCLTCGLIPTVPVTNPASTINIGKPVPFYDGTGRVVVILVNNPEPGYAIYEPPGYNGIGSPARLVNVVTPPGGGATLPGMPPGGILNRQREMRPSPDGTHVLFTRIVFGQTGNFQALPIVGALTANGDHYDVTNARVVWPTGESKQWTPDGKGVIIQGGLFDAGSVDDIMVDLSGQTGDILFPGSPFRGTRVTGNLDYDEDIAMSPNQQWIAVGSLRGFEALTPITRIVRQNFLPLYIAAPIYDQYADGQVRNVSNQNWVVAIADDLNRENGIPLFIQDDPTTPGVDEGDGWISRSMPSWNADGTAVAFWESGNGDEHGIAPTESRIVIANLKYTTSVGPVGDTTTVFNPSAFPDLTTYVAKTTPLPPTGTYNGVGGGTALVSEVINPTTHQTTRTVQYSNYVNEDGLILNGTESAMYGPSELSVTYLADVDITDATGANRGSLDANAVVTLLPTQSVTGFITSTLDGDTQTIPDPAKVEAVKTGA